MFFKQLATKEASLSYFFGCAGQGKAVAGDEVAGDEDWFIAEAERAQVRITQVIDTHVHADRYSGGRGALTRPTACTSPTAARRSSTSPRSPTTR